MDIFVLFPPCGLCSHVIKKENETNEMSHDKPIPRREAIVHQFMKVEEYYNIATCHKYTGTRMQTDLSDSSVWNEI